MAKRKFVLSKAEQKELLRAYRICRDAGTRTRYQAVRLYGEGYSEKEIRWITGCSRTSLMEWCRAYRADPLQGPVDKRAGGNHAKLSPLQIEELQHMLYQYSPKGRLGKENSTADGSFWNVEDLASVVQKRYGVKYQSRTSYLYLLRKCGFSYQKTEKVFKSRSESKVADYGSVLQNHYEEQLEKN
jgi:transposase